MVEIRPQPIEATLVKLLGAFFPSTLAGMIIGKLVARADPNVAFIESPKNFLRLTVDLFGLILSLIEFDFLRSLLRF